MQRTIALTTLYIAALVFAFLSNFWEPAGLFGLACLIYWVRQIYATPTTTKDAR